MNNKTSTFDWTILQGMKFFSYFGWGVSSIYSFIGVVAVAHLPWYMYAIAGVFAIGVNVVEAGMGRVTLAELAQKDVNGIVTVAFGFFCYLYDIWTNIAGFCFMFTGTANVALAWNAEKTLLTWPIIFGVLFAIGPEPLYRFYLTHTFPKPSRGYQVKPNQPKQQQNWKPMTPNYSRPAPTPPTHVPPGQTLKEYLKEKYPDQFKDNNA